MRLLRVIFRNMLSPAFSPHLDAPPPAIPLARVPIAKNGVDFRNKVVLAPMVRSGELPSRLTALHYGADLVWGPETIDRSLIGCTRGANARLSTVDFTRPSGHGSRTSLIYRIHPARESPRLIFQLGTAAPATAVQAALLVAPAVAGIDVNAGCPKSFSTSGGMGAALLRAPDRLCAILSALVEQVGRVHDIGISVKIRLLETPTATEALVAQLCRTGISGLTVHCRTTSMRPRERAIRQQLGMVGRVCREAGVACLMNGDVGDRDEALSLAEEFGVDGGMIATAAEANPSVFRRRVDGGKAPWQEVARQYVTTAMEVENRYGNTKFLLQHLIPGKNANHRTLQSARGYEDVCQMLGWEDLLAKAVETDQRLGLDKVERGPGKDVMQGRETDTPIEAASGVPGASLPGAGDLVAERAIAITRHEQQHQQRLTAINV